MLVKIFTGSPQTLEAEVTGWMESNRQRISHVLQSQSTAVDGQILLTITLFYEAANTGTNLGFRRNS